LEKKQKVIEMKGGVRAMRGKYDLDDKKKNGIMVNDPATGKAVSRRGRVLTPSKIKRGKTKQRAS